MNVLMLLTSHGELGTTGHKTGVWLEEFAAPYYHFRDAGFGVALASPLGGEPPLDPRSSDPSAATDATRRFNDDADAKAEFSSTHKLSEVAADGFDAVFIAGGHGPLWDLSEDPAAAKLIARFWTDGKPVSAVCHGSGVLKSVLVDGKPLVSGKRVTGFTNAEEDLAKLTDVVPYLLEDELKKLGGTFEAAAPFQSHAIVDGKLVTGQNPASSVAVADAVIELLKAK
jgi:putative intracellular protease/amidase